MKLHTYTAKELAEQARILDEYKRTQRIQAKLNERKAQADRLLPHFKLEPNDEPQRNLFSDS